MTDKGNSQGMRPIPDPTTLTTEALQREIKGLGELLRAEMAGDRRANDIRFADIEQRFVLIENQRIEQKEQAEKAVQAALAAQKDAVREQTASSTLSINKSEQATKEQASQANATFKAELTAVTNIVSDLKDRIGTMEAIKIGTTETRSSTRLDIGMFVGLIGIVIAIVTVIMSTR